MLSHHRAGSDKTIFSNSDPGKIVVLAPIFALLSTEGPFNPSLRDTFLGTARWLVLHLGQSNNHFPKYYIPAQKLVNVFSRLFPIVTWCSMAESVPIETSSPILFSSLIFALFPV